MRKEVKGRGEKDRYVRLNVAFQRKERRDKKASLSAKKQRKTIECERLDISSRKAETPREHFIQGSKCEMLGWMKHKLESKLPQEISVTSDMRMTPPLWQKVKN